MPSTKPWSLIALLVLMPFLQGCAAVVIGAAAAGTGGAAMSIFSDRRAANMSDQDSEIAARIINSLKQDSRIPDSSRVKVFSFNRIVLLAGEAPNQEMRQQIVNIARKVPNIRKIYNEVVISKPLPAAQQEYDMQIRMLGNAALLPAKVRASQVELTVSDRVVYIMGLLTRTETNEVIEIMRNQKGVKKVVPLVEYVRLK